ncbi:type I methionyl aminopeptidase [Desulfofustis glycolicus]|uniref:Methionine aminopeptidase n=1 Tax=Desulfofustis glycolicus DSM 9705 TaxID=1121409 RepID=A0A1M5Y6I8_9BACT|nr:type I methionyl aminopeptidase [Desulfofustis glycolicus]SHI07103.1 methionine aminopeptidase, type I [Desulfofustis glycolicus DSM 9705]
MFSRAQAPAGKSITLKSRDEIEIMAEANRIVAEVLVMMQKSVEPGISTWELDQMAEELCSKRQAVPAFKGYRGFPGSLCVSINEEVVHGIPSRKRKLKKGDIISVDFGTFYKGYYGDSAVTIPVGRIDALKSKLLQVTEESLSKAIEKVQVGNRIADISAAVQDWVERHGFSVVRQFVGHGIGSELHEGPEIPNFLQNGATPRLLEGMVLAIEPMVNIGTHQVKVLRDGWTVITADHKASAHFEHSIAVTADGPLVLSSREELS